MSETAAPYEVATVEEAELVAWRCDAPGCVIRPILAQYTICGGVLIRVSGNRRHTGWYVVDLTLGHLDTRCPACRAWSRLSLDLGSGTVQAAPRPQPWPDLD